MCVSFIWHLQLTLPHQKLAKLTNQILAMILLRRIVSVVCGLTLLMIVLCLQLDTTNLRNWTAAPQPVQDRMQLVTPALAEIAVPYYDSVYEAGEKDGESEGVDADSIALSQAQDIAIRGKWQKEQVKKFCRKYGSEEAGNTLPRPKSDARFNLLRHLLVNDGRKLLFCYLPKVGSTNMKRLLYVLNGILPMETITWDRIPRKDLKSGVVSSLGNPSLSDVERVEKLESYWKFVVLRNPLERLVSAYKNKLENSTNLFRESILKNKHSKEELKLDFQTYIQWIVDMPNEKLNEHFCPMVHLSQPCRVQYDFYGHFAHLSTDINLVMKKYQIPANYYHDKGKYQGQETSTLLDKYYSTVSPELKLALFKDFYIDLDYYYHLFPADRNSHVQLLGVNQTIL